MRCQDLKSKNLFISFLHTKKNKSFIKHNKTSIILYFFITQQMKLINNDKFFMKKMLKKISQRLRMRRLKKNIKINGKKKELKKKNNIRKKSIEEGKNIIEKEQKLQVLDQVEEQNQKRNEYNCQEMQSQSLMPLGQEGSGNDKSWYFSQKRFRDFDLSDSTFQALQKHNFVQMTHIQARTLNYLLKGRDILGAAKTGSGKTLAYLIPCMEVLRKCGFKQRNGTGIIIITPTRQLALQVYDVAKQLNQFHHKTVGCLIGGNHTRKKQGIALEKGVNLLICTPGRLLDHLQNSKFIYHNLLSLVIDEADRILSEGFEEQLTQILKVLPKQRQTILFSATQTRKIDDLAKLSLKEPLYIGVDDVNPSATVENLEQGYVVTKASNKFRLLLTFLRKNIQKHKKIMVFFSSCNAVKFYSDLLNYIDIHVMDIHGKQKQQKRSTTFHEFGGMKEGVLLCTDVAARGLDIPEVDWIIQYDPPLDIKEYIHRVGRTCRGFNAKGKALLFLLQEEEKYLHYLLQAKVELNEYEFEQSNLESIQEDFELLIQKNGFLQSEAKNAFKSYLHAYTTYSLKQVFNVHQLDLIHVARSFGLKKPPHVDLNIKLGGGKSRKLKQAS